MGSVADYPEWKQISLTSASCDGIPVTIDRIDSETRKQEEKNFETSLTTAASGTNQRSVRISPHPILFPARLIASLENFQEALNLAVSSIVDRWFESNDSENALFRRMPLQSHEDALLRVSYLLLTADSTVFLTRRHVVGTQKHSKWRHETFSRPPGTLEAGSTPLHDKTWRAVGPGM
jgi:hypothetical protein